MSAAAWELAVQMILIEVGPMMGFNSGFDISDEEDSDYCPPGGHLQTRVQGASSERWHHLGHFRTCSVTEGRARKWYHRMPKFGQRGGGWKVDIIHTCSGWHQPFGYVSSQWCAHWPFAHIWAKSHDGFYAMAYIERIMCISIYFSWKDDLKYNCFEILARSQNKWSSYLKVPL